MGLFSRKEAYEGDATAVQAQASPVGDEKHPAGLDVEEGHHYGNESQLKRHLGNRQIQLIAVGGSIGTALFVSISSGLISGGPGSLFIAYVVYCCLLALVSNSMAEMAVYMPISSSFVRMAGHWVDDAFGFAAGWNFFLYVLVNSRIPNSG